jgi:hypothetical protein
MACRGVPFDAEQDYVLGVQFKRLAEFCGIEVPENLLNVSALELVAKLLAIALQNALLRISQLLRVSNIVRGCKVRKISVFDTPISKSALQIGAVDERVLGAPNPSAPANVAKGIDVSFHKVAEELSFGLPVNPNRKYTCDHCCGYLSRERRAITG